METITYRLTSSAGRERRLELRGQRLLAGHADTGVFRIDVAKAPRTKAVMRVPRCVRDDGDGLAAASIDVVGPLAIVADERHGDPRNRCGCGGARRPIDAWWARR